MLKPTNFWRGAAVLFIALRAGDLVNLAAGCWLVPKYVRPETLGGVLPLTSLTTLLAVPFVAFALAVMKEASDLSGRGERGQLKSLLSGAFTLAAGLLLAVILVATGLLPRELRRLGIQDSLAAHLALGAGLVGCVAPIFTDQLAALARFARLGAVELSSALTRFATLLVAMPHRPLAGYFLGSLVQPLSRIALCLVTLRHDFAIPAERYFTRKRTLALLGRTALIAVFLGTLFGVSYLELAQLRTSLSRADSAGYYLATRLTDFLNYLTLPLLLALFPHAASAARRGESTTPLVGKCLLATLCAAGLMLLVFLVAGESLLALFPNGSGQGRYARYLPSLLGIQVMTATVAIFTQAQIAAGCFRFLRWFVPLGLLEAAVLGVAAEHLSSLPRLLGAFALFAALRVIAVGLDLFRSRW